MIKNILDMLNLLDHYGVSNKIEIAKGKNELVFTAKELWNKEVRKYKMKKNGKAYNKD